MVAMRVGDNSNAEELMINDCERNTVEQWLSRSFIFRIPVYQRHYAWGSKKDQSGPIDLFWKTVEEQTVGRLDGKVVPSHYMGAVLVDNKTNSQIDGVRVCDVVDGQQRLTTIQVALLAVAGVADELGCGDEIKEDLEKFIFSNMTTWNPRLHPTNFDFEQFKAVINNVYRVVLDFGMAGVKRENAYKSKIVSNFNFFHGEVINLVRKLREQYEMTHVFRELINSLTLGIDIVVIALRDTDNAQNVFESLNNFAKPLTTFDLIRNNVFSRAGDQDEWLFNQPVWQNLEDPYWEKASDGRKSLPMSHIEAYIARRLVTSSCREFLFNRNEIFKTFQRFSDDIKVDSIVGEVEALAKYSDLYRYLDGDVEYNSILPAEFGIFCYSIWNNRDFYPVIFAIAGSNVSFGEKQQMLSLLESYVVRRSVCRLASGQYNKFAVTICKKLGDNATLATLHDLLKSMKKDTYRFPMNKEVVDGCQQNKFNNSAFQQYILEKIECSLYDVKVERVIVEDGELIVDHILPKKWENNPQWVNIVLGEGGEHDENAVFTVNAYIDTIGNLTLMSGSNNSAKSNRPLDDVKNILSESTVKLNRELAGESGWNLEKIRARSKLLGEKICEIWRYDVK